MKYTLAEIAYIYRVVHSECTQRTYCKDCNYNGCCLLFYNLSVMVADEKFKHLADSILQVDKP